MDVVLSGTAVPTHGKYGRATSCVQLMTVQVNVQLMALRVVVLQAEKKKDQLSLMKNENNNLTWVGIDHTPTFAEKST